MPICLGASRLYVLRESRLSLGVITCQPVYLPQQDLLRDKAPDMQLSGKSRKTSGHADKKRTAAIVQKQKASKAFWENTISDDKAIV